MLETSSNKRQVRQASILQATITLNKGKDPKKSRYSTRACILCILVGLKQYSYVAMDFEDRSDGKNI